MLPPEILGHLREVAQKATPGNWKGSADLKIYGSYVPRNLPLPVCKAYSKADLDFIVAANPQTILALLAENERLNREADYLAKEVWEWDMDQATYGQKVRTVAEIREDARNAIGGDK